MKEFNEFDAMRDEVFNEAAQEFLLEKIRTLAAPEIYRSCVEALEKARCFNKEYDIEPDGGVGDFYWHIRTQFKKDYLGWKTIRDNVEFHNKF